jgi:hypothetical protein
MKDPFTSTALALPPTATPMGRARLAQEGMQRSAHELNFQVLTLLARAALRDTPALPLARQFQGPLRHLLPEAQLRGAQHPFLLVDMRLTRPDWWGSALSSRTLVGPALSGRPAFSKASAIGLGRGIITLLRHSTHIVGLEACLLGAHPVVLRAIGALSLADIERVAERNFSEVRPRWENRPEFWQKVIQAAAGDARQSRDLYLTGLQLLGNEIA